MKTIITLIFFFFCSLALGQGNIYYEYDAAGNSLPNGSTSKVNHAIGTFAISLYEFNLQGYWKGKAPLVSGISEPNKAGVLWLKWILTPLSF